MSRTQDLIVIIKGIQLIADASIKIHEKHLHHFWRNSSVRLVITNNVNQLKECTNDFQNNPKDKINKILDNVKETKERICVVAEGLQQFSLATTSSNSSNKINVFGDTSSSSADPRNTIENSPSLDVTSITLSELQEILTNRKHNKLDATSSDVPGVVSSIDPNSIIKDEKYVEDWMKFITKHEDTKKPNQNIDAAAIKTVYDEKTILSDPKNIEMPQLSSMAKQRKVPSSRISRIASFGSLFAGLGLGTVNELTKGALGLGGSKNLKEALLSPANTERIVDTLCKVRGAALKIGQILSIQDANVVSPEIIKAFDRVRQAADYMPDWQVQKVLDSELGQDWRNKLKSFDDKPFAAASIGQVHRGVLLDGTNVAIKVQYPGVAKSIESDIDNLVSMLKVWDIFPKGIFIDNIVKVAKRELAWEVDYIREAEYTEKFGEMFAKYSIYKVPKVIKEFTTKGIITTELMPGVPVDKCFDMNYEHRLFIAKAVFQLCMRELFEMRCMQTDPNWSNFLYDPQSMRLMLIDFGSTRFYTDKFIQNYSQIMECAVQDDYLGVLTHSRTMGFLTGYETKAMEAAHVNATMLLGEAFRYPGEYDFGNQKTTQRLATLVPTMIAHRLCPPPEEIYSIHRKLSGVFLLCSRLKVKMDCRPFYRDIFLKHKMN